MSTYTLAHIAEGIREELRACGVEWDEHTVQMLARDAWDADRDEQRRLRQREEREAYRRPLTRAR